MPQFKVGTQAGTTNYLELKEADPKYWNSYERRITYTCPLGFVIEVPGGNYAEQPDPISKDLQTFEVECAANAAANHFLSSGVPPFPPNAFLKNYEPAYPNSHHRKYKTER